VAAGQELMPSATVAEAVAEHVPAVVAASLSAVAVGASAIG
jgi:hypothetical protein